MARAVTILAKPAILAIVGTLFPLGANATYVQWVRCPDGSGDVQGFSDLWPTSNSARLILPSDPTRESHPILEFNISADYMGTMTCTELLEAGPPAITTRLDALGLSDVDNGPPANWTCLPYEERPAEEQRYLAGRGSQLGLVVRRDGDLGLLSAFSAQISFSVSSSKADPARLSSACIYSEITPQLRNEVSAVVQYTSIGVFLLVFVSGLCATLFPSASSATRRPTLVATGHRGHQQPTIGSTNSIVHRAILPGVGDCLLHLQFIFFLGALTLRYPGFYQPVTSIFHWSALFSPTGVFGQASPYRSVSDGLYEVNGTLTGSYGLELMSQLTGGPVSMGVWRNMLVILAIITAVVSVFLLALKSIAPLVPAFGALLPFEKEPDGQSLLPRSVLARGLWNVLCVVLSYFLAPIVAISAYQLDNVFLPAYHIALASLLILLVIVSLTWMWRFSPLNQPWLLLLDSSRAYRRVKTDDSDSDIDPAQERGNRDIFAGIFFSLAFARGIAVGGFQFSPLTQVVILAVAELITLVATAVLRPLKGRILSVFTWSCVARLVVVALTVVFLPTLGASIAVKSRIALVIFAIHSAVLVLGCAVPATIRLIGLMHSTWTPAEEPEIYGLSQLRRRSDVINDLSSAGVPASLSSPSDSIPTSADRSGAYRGHNAYNRSDSSTISFYLDHNLSQDALYLKAVPKYHYFRPPRSSSSTSLRRSATTSTSNSSAVRLAARDRPDLESGSSYSDDTSSRSPTSSSSTTSNQLPRLCTADADATAAATAEPLVLNPSRPSPPLAPHWRDYSFREADLYYGQQCAPTPEPSTSSTISTPALNQQRFTIRRVVSDVRDQWLGWKGASAKRPPAHKGFEVRRPPKPADI